MNWKSIITTAIITGIVTVLASMFLFWWQTKKPELTYNTIQSIPFDDASNKVFILQVEIKNSGDKPADEVVLIASFEDEIIQKSKIAIDRAISYTKSIGEKSIRLQIDSLNPGEGANVSILYQSPKLQSRGVTISLRAKGITGKMIGSNQKNTEIGVSLVALLAAYTGIFTFLLFSKKRRIMLQSMLNALIFRHSFPLENNQKFEIASILSMYGYPDKAKQYLSSSADRQYWVEADFLTADAILGDDKLRKDTIDILLIISKIPNIASHSQSIIYYNIARVYKATETNDNEVKKYLDLATGIDEQEVKDRLLRDPLFSC